MDIQLTIKVAWDNPEKTALLWTVEGRWTWDESDEAIAKYFAMADSVPHEWIDSIVDMSRGHLLPENVVSRFSRTLNTMHPKTGLIVMVWLSPFALSLLRVVITIQRKATKKIILVKTLDE